MTLLDLTKRDLPSFEQWLETNSPETKAPDFAAFSDLARRSQEQQLEQLTPEQAVFCRMWMGASIAAVEICNIEALRHKTELATIIASLPRVFAAATMYAIASVCTEQTPFREIAKAVAEEFRAAAKTAADSLEEDFSRSSRDDG